jgi:uncharacterized protein (UPF0212 family)
MINLSRRICFLLLSLLTVSIFGCGGGGSSAGVSSTGSATSINTTSLQKGAVIQGPVRGATVFADNVAAGTRFVQDAGEISAQTDTAGNFFLPSFPSYDFVLVSTGGIDSITGQPALLLLAPAGSANISPLTTLVALDTSKTIQAKLEALMGGTKFDTNVSTNSSPAVLLLIKSAETAVQSVNDAVKQAATNAGKTVTQTQLNYIQAQIWQQIALTFAGTPQNLATPAGLDSALTVAITSAITEIKLQNTNISTFAVSAATIADNAVDAALLALAAGVTHTSSIVLSTTTVQAESSLSSPATVFANALNSLKTAFSVILTSGTPSTYSPPPIAVVTTTSAAIIRIITGGSGGTGGIGIAF